MLTITEEREFTDAQIERMAEFILAKFEDYCANNLALNTNGVSNEDYCLLVDSVIARVKAEINAQVVEYKGGE